MNLNALFTLAEHLARDPEVARAIQKAQRHAPKGGIDIDGQHYDGGEFIPEHGTSVDKGPAGGGATRITKEQAQNIKEGMANMMEAVKSRADVRDGCYRGKDGIGWVDFLWGDEGAPAPDFSGGWGIAKEIAKRSYEHGVDENDPSAARTLMALPMVIVLGNATKLNPQSPKEKERIRLDMTIKGEKYLVFLVLDDKSKNHWLLSGFELRSARTKGGSR